MATSHYKIPLANLDPRVLSQDKQTGILVVGTNANGITLEYRKLAGFQTFVCPFTRTMYRLARMVIGIEQRGDFIHCSEEDILIPFETFIDANGNLALPPAPAKTASGE